MCTGAILAAHCGRVVWVTDDDNFGGFRSMRGAGLFPHRFSRIATLQAPYPDLDQRQRIMLDAWRANRGGTQPSWTLRRQEG